MGMLCAVQLVLLLQALLVSGEQTEISLNGDSWKISDSMGKVKDQQATVPGNVHLDLLRHNIIEEPYNGWNDWLYQWVGYDNWTYTLQKELTSANISGKTVWLKCDGLDTAATVSVNNKMVGTANNMHRQYLFDITDAVKAGQNMLSVEFESAANYSVRTAAAYPYPVYIDGGPGLFFNDSMRNFVRKAQSDFGWDWGPAYVPTGIWQNISIVTFEDAYVSYVIPKTDYDVNSKSYYLTVTVCVILPAAQELTVDLKTTSADFDEATVGGSFKVSKSGETCQTLASKPIDPNTAEKHFWWPLGVKWPPQQEHTLIKTTTVVGIFKTNSRIATVEVKKNVGFRHIEIVQNPVGDNGKDGLTFYFQMTSPTKNYPFYAKGSNFIPMDAFVSRATPDVARKILEAAVNGRHNMIRIWGGGLYQPDWFYDMCDEMGIMVWQEFMFADALYPRDNVFLANVEAEVRHVVRRLGHHASIVLWSGNNENQGIAQANNSFANVIDYSVLYDQTIRATLWEEDETRPYWPSSPSNGYLVDDREKNLYIQRWGNSGDPMYGDLHRYDYGDYCTDVTKFPRPRFASEFGFQSYSSFHAMSQVSGPADWSNVSPLMMHRQHHPDGNTQMKTQMAMFFHLPNNTDKEAQFRDFIYLSQVIQGICIGAEAEHYRRLLSEDGAYTRGTLYWQLNDIWQTQSWASVEYSGQWKILHHYIKRAYEPVLLSSYQVNGSAVVYVVVDIINYDISYGLTVEAVSWKSGKVMNSFKRQGLKSEGFTGVQVWTEKLETIFKGSSTTEGFLYMTITSTGSPAGQLLAESWLFPSNFTKVELPAAKITASGFKSSQDKNEITFTLSSSAVAPYVYLESGDYYGVFSDNGFLMMPNKKYDASFTSWSEVNVQKFQSGLKIRSLYDTYNDVQY